MQWTEGHEWVASVALPPGSHAFKCVVVESDGTAAEWEVGPNRTLQVELEAESFIADCPWNVTETINATASIEEEASAQSDDDAPGSENLSEMTSFLNGSSDELEEAATSDDASAVQDVRSADPQASGNGSVGEQEGEAKSYSERDSDTPDPGQTVTSANQAEASAGQPLTSSSAQSPEVGSPKASSSSSCDPISSGSPPSSAKAAREASASNPIPQALDLAQEGLQQEPGGVPGWLLATAAVAAVPVMLWSEFTLKATGCGLPPGPGGLLGAAEGVSYIAVAVVALWSLVSAVRLRGGRAPREGAQPGWRTAALGSVYGTVAAGLVVLGLQVKDYGYIPGALPDANCHGEPASFGALPQGQSGLAAAPALRDAQAKVGQALQSSLAQLSSSSTQATGSSQQNALEGATKGLASGMDALASSVQQTGAGFLDRFRGFMNIQEEEMEEVQAGALDGLSGADVTSVVDELQAAAGRLKEFLAQHSARKQGGSSSPASPAWLQPLLPAGVNPSRLPLASLPLPQMALVDPSEVAQHSSASSASAVSPVGPHLPRWVSSGDMSFMAAATNAVTAAANVTSQLSTVAVELQGSVDQVRAAIEDAHAVARLDSHVDVRQLSTSMATLESALGAAQDQATHLDFQPLAAQLRSAAFTLRQSANGSAEAVQPIASRLEAAAGDLLQAADAANPAQIEAAREHLLSLAPEVRQPVFSGASEAPSSSLGDQPEPAAPEDEPAEALPSSVQAAVDPAVQEADNAVSKLQQVVTNIRRVEPALGLLKSLNDVPLQVFHEDSAGLSVSGGS